MKIKKFKNIWTMGIIICAVILVLFYVLKRVNPDFIVGVAESKSIVEFGTYVDSHKLAFYIFHFVVGYVGWFLLCCASNRKYKLNSKQNIFIIFILILSIIIQEHLPTIYTPFNYVMSAFVPFMCCYIDNNITNKTFISTISCFSVDIMAQSLSKEIRNVVLITTCINSASMTILLIDGIIWRILFYLFYNHKKEG